MTTERKKAIITIVSTLIIGILIGLLASGLVHRQRGGARRASGWKQGGRDRFIERINDVVHATPEQATQIRPLIVETSARIDSLQSQTDRQVRNVLDSLEVRLSPILSADQVASLKEFHERGRRHR